VGGIIRLALKLDPEADQFLDPRRPRLHHQLDDVLVAQPGPGAQGVLDVQGKESL
jgi:hypothetical protein